MAAPAAIPWWTCSGRRSIARKAARRRLARRRQGDCWTAPAAGTVAGLRDRAILSVGLQVGLRRAEIAALTVSDLHQNRGLDALRLTRKGGRRDALAINPQTAARIRAYLEMAGHGSDQGGPLFRPLRGNARVHDPAGRMDPDGIDRVLRKYAAGIGLALLGALNAGDVSSPRRWRTGRSWRTCKRRLDTVTHLPPNYTIAEAIPREGRQLLCDVLNGQTRLSKR